MKKNEIERGVGIRSYRSESGARAREAVATIDEAWERMGAMKAASTGVRVREWRKPRRRRARV